MPLEIAIRENARQDIYDIIAYGTAQHGIHRARTYIGQLNERMQWLQSNAKLGTLYDGFDGTLRSYRQGQHRIYYTFDDHQLVIVRIMHVRSDAKRHLT